MKLVSIYMFLLCSMLLPSQLVAQKDVDEPVGIFATQQEYHEFMGSFKQAAQGDEQMRAMIPLINDVVLGKPIGWSAERYGGSSSNLGLLSNPDVRESIEMVDDQYEDLQKLNGDIQKKLVEQIRDFDFSGKSKEEVAEQIRKMQQDANEELESVLLPHQTTRLSQIFLQNQLRRRSLAMILTSDPAKSDLEISDSQAEKLLEAEKEIEKDLEEQIAKLREEARGKLLDELKPEQKEKAEDMIGEMFKFADRKKNARKKGEKKSGAKKSKTAKK